MIAVPKFTGICPNCGRKVATTSDGVIRRNHRPDPNVKTELCMSWGVRATTVEKVESE